MFKFVFVALIAIVGTPAKADGPTYGNLLGEERINALVRCELGALPDRINRDVRIAPGFVSWSVKRIVGVAARTDDRQKAVDELRSEYQEFLSGLAEFSVKDSGVAVISPSAGEEYLSSARRCGKIPCSQGCCQYCDPCSR